MEILSWGNIKNQTILGCDKLSDLKNIRKSNSKSSLVDENKNAGWVWAEF